MILPTGATVAVTDGETARLIHNTAVKPGVHLVEITATLPARNGREADRAHREAGTGDLKRERFFELQ